MGSGRSNYLNKSISNVIELFHDRKGAYHLMELSVGGKLLSLFDKFDSSDQSQFCVVAALTHLATYKVVHRDLRPKNIMVYSKGQSLRTIIWHP
mmetsp:Transcript_5932/g.7923  ORF Transcript_5932/g.7923 Transcript_5932/m.7923 type:complete len:94 (+) Transcript_5932:188-469(+)